MQISDEIIELLLVQGGGRHHFTAMHNRLCDELVIGEQAAGQILSLVQPFQAGSLVAPGAIGVVAGSAIVLIDAPSLNLLGIQSQLGVGRLRLAAATGQQSQKNYARQDGRLSPQVTIMSVAQPF